MENHDERTADLLIREVVAGAEMSELAGMLMFSGWAVDMHTFPGTLTASKNNGRLFYPGGVGGRWDTVISEMRPADGLIPVDLSEIGPEVVAWQVHCTQSTPLDKLVAVAELTTGAALPSSPMRDVEDFFRVDDQVEGDDDTP